MNQRAIEYTLDDIDSLNLRTFEWKTRVENYTILETIDVTGLLISAANGQAKVKSQDEKVSSDYTSNFHNKYLLTDGKYSKASARYDIESDVTYLRFEDSKFLLDTSQSTIDTYSLTLVKEEQVKDKNTSHGIIAQDLLELPKFTDMVTDSTQFNVDNNLTDGDVEFSYLSVDYSEFIPVLLAGLQDASQLIKGLRTDVDIPSTSTNMVSHDLSLNGGTREHDMEDGVINFVNASFFESFPVILLDSDGVVRADVPFRRAESKYSIEQVV
jgi:hypothetical protein